MNVPREFVYAGPKAGTSVMHGPFKVRHIALKGVFVCVFASIPSPDVPAIAELIQSACLYTDSDLQSIYRR